LGSRSSSMSNEQASYRWSCGCGDVKFKMYGEPVREYNCCCQSCLACADHIMAKGGQGTDWHAPKSESPGVAIALFPSHKVEPEKPEELSSKVGYVKVQQNGTMIRWYTKCCNTPIGNLGGPGNCGFNYNCVTNPDGSRYERNPKLLNIMYIYAKHPDEVPEPRKDDVRDIGFIMTVIPNIIHNKRWCCLFSQAHPAFLPDPAEVSEWVPKTWKDP
jgi:hypothetical protein